MCQAAVETLHKQGFVIAAGLKTLKKDGWARLGLPLAIEEELKTQIMSKVYYSQVPINNTVPYNILPVWPASYWGVNSGQVYQYVQYDQEGQKDGVEHEQHSEEAHALQSMHQSDDKIDLDGKQQFQVLHQVVHQVVDAEKLDHHDHLKDVTLKPLSDDSKHE